MPKHDESTIRLKQPQDKLFADASQLCCRLLLGWQSLDPSKIEVTLVTGGITNALLKLLPRASNRLEPVLLRVFGDKTELVINRERESRVTVQLHSSGFGAEVLGTFSNGRVESWIHMRALKPAEMCTPDMAVCIARRLAHFHSAHVAEDKQPQVFQTILDWLQVSQELDYPDPDKQRAKDAVDFAAMRQEVQEMQDVCNQLHAPVVWSHNDLLSGNIMIPFEGTPELQALKEQQADAATMQFIDFEYGAYFYRGYDIGNHWDEYAGFEGDYSRYPDSQQQHLFAKNYLREQQQSEPAPQEVEQLVKEANVFALVAHQFWGVWCFIQARYSDIDFDYMEYSTIRWNEYHKRKLSVLEAIK